MARGWERRGDNFKFVSVNQEALHEKLPAGVYNVGYNMFTGYFFEKIKDCFESETLYGGVEKRAEKVLTTYKSREKATGAIFVGNKGSGKTAITKLIANKAIKELNLPVIMCSAPHSGDAFNEFISEVGECVMIFDEFAKVYKDEQQQLLTLLDGTMSTKRLCLFTENTTGSLNEYIKERPGRAFYLFKYKKLDTDTIKDYCTINLSPARHHDIPEIITYSATVNNFSFDILKALIEECNRFPEDSFEEICKDLNIETPSNLTTVYEIKNVEVLEEEIKVNHVLSTNVLRNSQNLYVYHNLPEDFIQSYKESNTEISGFIRKYFNDTREIMKLRVPEDKKQISERQSNSSLVETYGSPEEQTFYKLIQTAYDESISFDMSDCVFVKTNQDGTKTYAYNYGDVDVLLTVKEYKEAPAYFKYL